MRGHGWGPRREEARSGRLWNPKFGLGANFFSFALRRVCAPLVPTGCPAGRGGITGDARDQGPAPADIPGATHAFPRIRRWEHSFVAPPDPRKLRHTRTSARHAAPRTLGPPSPDSPPLARDSSAGGSGRRVRLRGVAAPGFPSPTPHILYGFTPLLSLGNGGVSQAPVCPERRVSRRVPLPCPGG